MICPFLSMKYGTGDRVCAESECRVWDVTMNDCGLKVMTAMKWKLWEEYTKGMDISPQSAKARESEKEHAKQHNEKGKA